MLFCSNLLLQAMGFAYRMALNRFAGDEALGLNSLVMQIYQLMTAFCISGVNVAVTGLAARLDRERIPSLFKAALTVYFGLWLAAAVPFAVFSKQIASAALSLPALKPALLLMLLCILMTGIENVLKSIHIGVGLVRTCAFSELCEQGVRFALVSFLLKELGGGGNAETVFLIVLGMTCSELVSLSVLITSYRIRFVRGTERKKHTAPIKKVITAALPASAGSAASTLFSSAGSLILPGLLCLHGAARSQALSQIGVLNTAAMPVAMLPLTLIGAFAAVLMPEISSISGRGIFPARTIKRAFVFGGAFCLLTAIILLVFSERIMMSCFGKATDPTVTKILIVGSSLTFMRLIGAAVMNGLMKQKQLLLITVLGDAYGFALILLTTPVLGLSGYLSGSALGELFKLLLTMHALKGFYKSGMEITGELC